MFHNNSTVIFYRMKIAMCAFAFVIDCSTYIYIVFMYFWKWHQMSTGLMNRIWWTANPLEMIFTSKRSNINYASIVNHRTGCLAHIFVKYFVKFPVQNCLRFGFGRSLSLCLFKNTYQSSYKHVFFLFYARTTEKKRKYYFIIST